MFKIGPLFKSTHGNGANSTHKQVWEGGTTLPTLEMIKTVFPALPRLLLCKLKVMESPPPHGLFVCRKPTFSSWLGMLPGLTLPFPFAIFPRDFPKQYKKRSQHHSDKLSPATMPIKMIFLTPRFSEPDICPKSQVIHTILPLTWVILQTSFCYS